MSRVTGGEGLPAGVAAHPRSGKFQARITAQGQRRSLGYFDTAAEAHAAYLAAGGRLALEVAAPREAKSPQKERFDAKRDKRLVSQGANPLRPTAGYAPGQFTVGFAQRFLANGDATLEAKAALGVYHRARAATGLERTPLRQNLSVVQVLIADGLLDHPDTVAGVIAAVSAFKAHGVLALVTDDCAKALGDYVPRLTAEEYAAELAAGLAACHDLV